MPAGFPGRPISNHRSCCTRCDLILTRHPSMLRRSIEAVVVGLTSGWHTRPGLVARDVQSALTSSFRNGGMRKRTNRNCAFEQLENRRMLAGTVTTSLQGNVLTISGDDAANSMAVFNSSPGVVQVLGLDGTTISGTTLFTNVTGINFNFNAGLSGVNKGNDVIVVTNLTLVRGNCHCRRRRKHHRGNRTVRQHRRPGRFRR